MNLILCFLFKFFKNLHCLQNKSKYFRCILRNIKLFKRKYLFVRIRLKVMLETICILSSAEDNAMYCFGRFVIALFILNWDRSMLLRKDIWLSMHYHSKICKKSFSTLITCWINIFVSFFILFNIFLSTDLCLSSTLFDSLFAKVSFFYQISVFWF